MNCLNSLLLIEETAKAGAAIRVGLGMGAREGAGEVGARRAAALCRSSWGSTGKLIVRGVHRRVPAGASSKAGA